MRARVVHDYENVGLDLELNARSFYVGMIYLNLSFALVLLAARVDRDVRGDFVLVSILMCVILIHRQEYKDSWGASAAAEAKQNQNNVVKWSEQVH